jgi:hypothetical protein
MTIAARTVSVRQRPGATGSAPLPMLEMIRKSGRLVHRLPKPGSGVTGPQHDITEFDVESDPGPMDGDHNRLIPGAKPGLP